MLWPLQRQTFQVNQFLYIDVLRIAHKIFYNYLTLCFPTTGPLQEVVLLFHLV